MQDDADETIVRIAAALRPLPDVDPAQKARVLVAVAAERERDRRRRARTGRMLRLFGGGASLIAAGLIGAFWLRGSQSVARREPVAATAAAPEARAIPPSGNVVAGVPVQPATHEADGVALHPVQLVLRAPAAHRVSVVGDFNGWDSDATTMTKDPESGLWSRTLALRPGRHVYAFVVDDSVWMSDPRTPVATDADFGRPGSVLLVGRP